MAVVVEEGQQQERDLVVAVAELDEFHMLEQLEVERSQLPMPALPSSA